MKSIDVLFIEDDEGDIDLAMTALGFVCKSTNFKIRIARDGEKPSSFFSKNTPIKRSPPPTSSFSI